MCSTCMPGACKGKKKSTGSPGTEVMDGCETPYGCWELNLSSLQQQQMFLTTEPFLQALSNKPRIHQFG